MSNVQDGTSVRVDLSQGAVKEYTVDLDILPCDVNDAVAKRRGAAPIAPELVTPSEVLAPAFYKRLTGSKKKRSDTDGKCLVSYRESGQSCTARKRQKN